MQKLLTTLLALLLFAGCNSIAIVDTTPTSVCSDYYIALAGGKLFIGQEIGEISGYVIPEEDPTLRIHQLGLYDFTLQDNIITSIRTASPEIKLSSYLYVGQTEASLESYLPSTIKHKLKDRVLYYDVVNEVGVEVAYDEENKAEVIRFKSMALTE